MASRSQRKLRAEFKRETSRRFPEDRTTGFLTTGTRRRFNPIASALWSCCGLGYPRIIEDEEDHFRPGRATPTTARRHPKDESWVVEEVSETELNFPSLNYGEDGLQSIHEFPQEFRLGETIPAEGSSPACVITAKNWSNLTGSGAKLHSSSLIRKSGRKGVACARITEVPESEDLSALEKSNKTSRTGRGITTRARKWFRGFLKTKRSKVLQMPQPWSGVEERGAGEYSWNQNRQQLPGIDCCDRLSLTSSVITDDFEEYISLGETSDERRNSVEVHGSGNCEDLGRGRRPRRDEGVLTGRTRKGRKSSCLRQSEGNGLGDDPVKNQMRPADVKKTIANEDAKSSPSEDHCTDHEPYCPPCVYKTSTGAKVILIHVQPVRKQPGDGGTAEFRGFGPPVKPESPCRAISENKHDKSKTLSNLGREEMKNGISTKTSRELGVTTKAKRSTTGAKKAINQVQEIKTSQNKEVLVSKVPKLPAIQGDTTKAKRSTTGAKKVINQVQEIKTSQNKEVLASIKPKLPAIQGDRKPSSQPRELIESSHKEEEELTERQREDEAQKKRNLEILARNRQRSKRLGSQPPPPAPARPVKFSPRPPIKVASLPVTMTETTVSEPGRIEENCRNTQMMMTRLTQGQRFGGHIPGKKSRPSPGKNGSDMQQQSDIFSCCQQMLESSGEFQEENWKATISVNKKWLEMKQQKARMFAANHASCPGDASRAGKRFTGSREGHPFHHKEREGPGIRAGNNPTLDGEDEVDYRGRFIRFCWPHPKDTQKRIQRMAPRKHGKKRITVESPFKLSQIVEEPVENDCGTKLQTNSKQKCREATDSSLRGNHRGLELTTGGTVDQNYPGTPYPRLSPADHLVWTHGTLSDPRRGKSQEKNTKKFAGLREYHTAIAASKSGMPGPDEMVNFIHGEEDGIELIEL